MKEPNDVTVGGTHPLVLCIASLSSVASFFCICLLILWEREKAYAVVMCPFTFSFGFLPSFSISVLAVFVAILMES